MRATGRLPGRWGVIGLSLVMFASVSAVSSPASGGEESGDVGVGELGGTILAGAIFAPGTDPAYAEGVLDAIQGPSPHQFGSHWNPTFTALNNGGGAQGDALELTWSIIPDGTNMPSQAPFDTTCNSNLIATFDAVYGAGVWQAEIQTVWNDWTNKTGNVYTPAVTPDANGTPIDDGAVWPISPGLANVRGDIRIGGCAIDGNFNTLAFNFFPTGAKAGDMKIESTDSFFSSNPISPWFHNVFSHEHGHGAGLAHVCPINLTKLMEPTVTGAFTGLQHDDIRGIHRGYGDRFEVINNPNDSQGAATAFTLAPTQAETGLSLDSTGDTDWFAFSATAGNTLDVTVTPTGLTYNEGADPGALCAGGTTPGSPLNSLALQDLSFEIRNGGGVLTTVNATGAGAAETISGFLLPATGTYFVRVLGTGTDDAQLYDISATRNTGSPPTLDFGDAPDPTYPTLLASDGARHANSGPWLGPSAAPDLEFDGQPTAGADGDDNNGTADENGVVFTSALGSGTSASVDVTSSAPQLLNAWVDFNGDGDWTDTGEQIFTDTALAAGVNSLTFPVPAGATVGSTYARFRVNPAGGLAPTGLAADGGEVEDYAVAVVASLPGAPSGVSGVAGAGQVAVSWLAPVSTGGSPITGYVVTASPGGATCSTTGALSCTVTGLSNGTPYTFTVTASNAVGAGPVSAASAAVTPVGVPGAPSGVSGVAGNGQVVVSWLAPVSTGGSPITGYTVTASPGGATCSTTGALTCAVTGLTGGVAYTFTVTASNAVGAGSSSVASSPVAPIRAFVGFAPTRLLESRVGEVTTVDGLFWQGGLRAAGSVTELTVAGRGGVAADASAVVLNVAVTAPQAPGYVTAYPCGATRPTASNLNYNTGQTISNAVIAKVGVGGKVCLYTEATTHLVVDANGFFPAGSEFAPLSPQRLLESRVGEVTTVDGLFWQGGLRAAGSVTELTVAGRGGVAADASAVVLNVAVTGPQAPGYVTAYPCGATRPTASNLNYNTGETISNAVIAKVGVGGKVCLYTEATTHLVVDVNGFFPAGSAFAGFAPTRLLESRVGEVTTVDGLFWQGGLRAAGSVTELTVAGRGGVGADASAVVLNLAVTGPQAPGYVTAYPCGATRPTASNLNYNTGQTISNAVIATIGVGGKVCLYTEATTHLIVDANGFFPA